MQSLTFFPFLQKFLRLQSLEEKNTVVRFCLMVHNYNKTKTMVSENIVMVHNYNKTKTTVSENIGIVIKCSRLKFNKVTYSSLNRFPLVPELFPMSV